MSERRWTGGKLMKTPPIEGWNKSINKEAKSEGCFKGVEEQKKCGHILYHSG